MQLDHLITSYPLCMCTHTRQQSTAAHSTPLTPHCFNTKANSDCTSTAAGFQLERLRLNSEETNQLVESPESALAACTIMAGVPDAGVMQGNDGFEPSALDVLAINNLISSFVQCLDSGDGPRLASLFAPGGTINVSADVRAHRDMYLLNWPYAVYIHECCTLHAAYRVHHHIFISNQYTLCCLHVSTQAIRVTQCLCSSTHTHTHTHTRTHVHTLTHTHTRMHLRFFLLARFTALVMQTRSSLSATRFTQSFPTRK